MYITTEPESARATITFNLAYRFFGGMAGFVTPPCLFELAVVIIVMPSLFALTPWALAPFLILPIATGIYTILNGMKLRRQEQCYVTLQRSYFFITIPGRFVLAVRQRNLEIAGPETVVISGRFTSMTIRTSTHMIQKIERTTRPERSCRV